MSNLDKFKKHGGYDEKDPLERLRFFCSLAMNNASSDWLDVEQFFIDVEKDISRTKAELEEAVSLLRSTTSLINQLYNFDSGGYEDFEEMVAVGKFDNKIKAFLSSQPNGSSEE